MKPGQFNLGRLIISWECDGPCTIKTLGGGQITPALMLVVRDTPMGKSFRLVTGSVQTLVTWCRKFV